MLKILKVLKFFIILEIPITGWDSMTLPLKAIQGRMKNGLQEQKA